MQQSPWRSLGTSDEWIKRRRRDTAKPRVELSETLGPGGRLYEYDHFRNRFIAIKKQNGDAL